MAIKLSAVYAMNRKALETIWHNMIFIAILMFLVLLMFGFVSSKMNGAPFWSDYYAKELSKIINQAQPGDIITIDVQKAFEIARNNELATNSEIFQFDNKENELCVKLAKGRKTCYTYFNNVNVINQKIKFSSSLTNILEFEITKKENDNF